MSLLWFDNLCLSWSLLGGQGMNAWIWFYSLQVWSYAISVMPCTSWGNAVYYQN